MANGCKRAFQIVVELLDDILSIFSHSVQSGLRSFAYNAVEQVMLDLLHKDVNGKSLDAQAAKYFDTNSAAEGL